MFSLAREAWAGVLSTIRRVYGAIRARDRRLDHLVSQVEQLRRETRLLLGSLSLPETQAWQDKSQWRDGGPGAGVFPNSTLCRQESFEQPYFPYWLARVGSAPVYHRKNWEFVFICQSLWERGAIRPGARGLGFGVGREPLTAFFASEGCDVVATDLASDAAVELGWSRTVQHAANVESLRYEHVCPGPEFDQHVRFRVCDMNQIPADLDGFDFCWSACAFEHLGSINNGLRFVERSVDCLKIGGWAVHTTEFNVSSNDLTIDNGNTVLFRRRDMEALAQRLTAKGHHVAPFNFDPGLGALDRYIDVAPFRPEPHLKLALEGFATTSFGIIVQRGGGAA